MHVIMIAFASFATNQAGSAAPQSGIQLMPVPARIEVTGHGEVKYLPDVATIEYTIRGEGSTSDEAVLAMTESGARIDAALHSIDATAHPRTSEVRIAVVRSDACKERGYREPQLSIGACAITGYVATQSVILRTLAVTDAGTMVGLVGRAGGLSPRIENFTVRDSRPQQQQAIAAALADAASKAAAMAAASHVQLGPILHMGSGRRHDAQQITVTGSRSLSGRAPAPPPPPPVPVNVDPVRLTTDSYVTVTCAIIQ